MKSYLGRILICVVPVVLATAVCAWAYSYGRFRLGVDLVGGTILVYEVDKKKQTDSDAKPEDLAAALKKRIDPADLLNVTIRPVGGETPRVEIILPTGSQEQQRVEQQGWNKLIQEATAKYPPPEDQSNSYKVPLGQTRTLIDRISKLNPKADAREISEFVESRYKAPTGRRALTSEQVDIIKNLIQQQGKLEFRILANPTDDKDAIARATDYIANEAHAGELDRLAVLDEVPPPPRNEDGSLLFPVALGGETINYGYTWIEVGKEELYNLHLNNSAEKSAAWGPMWNTVAEARNNKTAILFGGGEFLLYSRRMPPEARARLSPKDNEQGKMYEYFILTRNPESKGKEITGDDLSRVVSGQNQRGEPAVHFSFTSDGGGRFYDLTKLNRPADPSSEGGFRRRLAIVLDNQIRSAPSLNQAIRDNGEISGGFTPKSVQELVTILRAGALPATLKKNPVSENSMGPTLGSDTIFKGTLSVGLAFLAVLLFMLFYYRFAGIVACVALLANLVLTVAFMVLVNATFTLPGLAGLVLMLGMAVDANVLIYERLREERERGASLALAIRNGYDRAFPTIIDTHLSSIFTAIVLYVVGNDQLKGFGISLTMGLIISLFTSLFMTRTMFDFWMAKGWLHRLTEDFFQGLVRLLHRHHWDFMGIRYYWFTATIVLTVLGAGLFVWRLNPDERGGSVMNIDFMGGTAYTGKLAAPLTIGDLREKLENVAPAEIEKEAAELLKTFKSGQGAAEDNALPDSLKQGILGLLDTLGKNRPVPGVSEKDIAELRQKLEALPPNESLPDATRAKIEGMLDTLSGLPDISIEQLYLTSDPRGRSSLFTVRTADKDARKVQRIVNTRLGDALEYIALKDYKIDADNKTATLKFTRPAKEGEEEQPGFASKAQLTMLLHEEGLQDFRIEEMGQEEGGRYSEMKIVLSDPMPPGKYKQLLEQTKEAFEKSPQPQRLENFDAQLAKNTQERALYAILASWAAILLYLWFRFGNWTFGAAAVLCLLHDLFFTLGVIAACHYLHGTAIGNLLAISDFKIDLPAIAALLTLVGYSVNDTIVVFDRIREVRGKNPMLTATTINDSVNQTLTRTILSSMTVWLVVIVLYAFGGEGVHLFAFVMIVGVVVGTYSSIYIASPLLLIFGEGAPSARDRARQVQPAATTEA